MQKIAQNVLANFKSLRLVKNAIEVTNAYDKMKAKLLAPSVMASFLVSSSLFLVACNEIMKYYPSITILLEMSTFIIVPLSTVCLMIFFTSMSEKLLNKFSKKWRNTKKAYKEVIQEFSELLKEDAIFSHEIYTFLEDAINISNMRKNTQKEKKIIIDNILNNNAQYLISKLETYQKHLELVAQSENQKDIMNSDLTEFEKLNMEYRKNRATDLKTEQEISIGELKKYL